MRFAHYVNLVALFCAVGLLISVLNRYAAEEVEHESTIRDLSSSPAPVSSLQKKNPSPDTTNVILASNTATSQSYYETRGIGCMKGTALQSSKILKSCHARGSTSTPVAAFYCDQIEQAKNREAVCGQWSRMAYEPAFPSIDAARTHNLAARDALRSQCEPTLLAALGGTIPVGMNTSNDGVTTPPLLSVIHRNDTSRRRRLYRDSFDSANGFTEHQLLVPAFSQCRNAVSKAHEEEEEEASYQYLSPVALVALLYDLSIGRDGHGMLMTGDSMMRQLMLRMVSFIRKQEHFSEHYFHKDGLFVLYDEHDELTVQDEFGASHREILHTLFPGYLLSSSTSSENAANEDEKEAVQQRIGFAKERRIRLAILFLWDPTPTEFRKEFVRMKSTGLHFASFMYWWNQKAPLSDIEPYWKAVEGRYLEGSDDGKTKTTAKKKTPNYFFVTTPWTDPGVFGGVEFTVRQRRNAAAAKWVATVSHTSPGAISLLDMASLAEVHRFPKTLDQIHYACIWTPKHPDRITRQKYNYNECRDPFGLAVVQWLAHQLLLRL